MAEPRPRRGHGEDSIYFDQANNHWVGAVSLGYKAGKRVRKTVTGRTKTAVKTKLRQLRQELDNGVRSSATYTVGNALDDWLASGLSGRSDRTRELYRDTVKPMTIVPEPVSPLRSCRDAGGARCPGRLAGRGASPAARATRIRRGGGLVDRVPVISDWYVSRF